MEIQNTEKRSSSFLGKMNSFLFGVLGVESAYLLFILFQERGLFQLFFLLPISIYGGLMKWIYFEKIKGIQYICLVYNLPILCLLTLYTLYTYFIVKYGYRS